MMHFTQKQVSEILEEILEKEDGLNTILKMSLEALMKSERTEHNKSEQDYNNGYHSRKAFGNQQMLELHVPCTRNGGFYPVILGLLKTRSKKPEASHFIFINQALPRDR